MDLKTYNKYNPIKNPISQYAIRPALKLADAHNHPIRGGIAAAISSGLAHYGLIEAIGQTSHYLLGVDCIDPHTGMTITNIPAIVHFLFGVNMISNIGIGVEKYLEKKDVDIREL